MKQKDIALIIIIVAVAGLVSYFVSNALFSKTNSAELQVEVVEVINPEFPEPDTRYFNGNSVDPTQLIQIGNNQNNQPFSTQSR